jgi:hypothetical protein
MPLNSIICYAAALLTAVIAIVVLYRDPRAFVHRIHYVNLLCPLAMTKEIAAVETPR